LAAALLYSDPALDLDGRIEDEVDAVHIRISDFHGTRAFETGLPANCCSRRKNVGTWSNTRELEGARRGICHSIAVNALIAAQCHQDDRRARRGDAAADAHHARTQDCKIDTLQHAAWFYQNAHRPILGERSRIISRHVAFRDGGLRRGGTLPADIHLFEDG